MKNLSACTLVLLALLPPGVRAQEEPETAASQVPEVLSPPPLVSLPEEREEPPAEAPPESPQAAAGPRRRSTYVSAGELVPRATVELLAGSAGGLVGASAGFAAGLLFALPRRCEEDTECLAPAFVGAAAGLLAGIPIGVWAGGSLLAGRGGFLPALGGSLLGWGATLLVANSLSPSGETVGQFTGLALLFFPVLGATVGYELAHASAERYEPRPTPSLHFAPLLSLGETGGRLGLAGQF